MQSKSERSCAGCWRWLGTFVEYAGKQGVQVTALTLALQSIQYLEDLIQRQKLPCDVKFGDFYQYTSPEGYKAVVILGVMEHPSGLRCGFETTAAFVATGWKNIPGRQFVS